jgi:DNA-binding XRE family transcriptional regulator/quercetin dioxygenase-like cupin family protein
LSLGKGIRLARVRKDLTVTALAEQVGVSPSMISKIEHDVTNPSLDLLRKIAMELHIAVGDLVAPDEASADPSSADGRCPGYVGLVRADERKLLRLPGSGILYQVLTPDLQGAAEFVWVELEPGDQGHQPIQHQQGEEVVLVLEGTLHVYLEEDVYVLNAEDCITFDATLRHYYANESDRKVTWVYIAVPPTL